MSLVSKYPLSKDIEDECFDLFYDTIAHLSSKQEIKDFLDDFLSPVEQIMLAKRLGIAILLGKGYTYDSIKKVLHVTPPTIAMVNLQLKYAGTGYRRIVERVLIIKKWNDFWQKVDDVIADLVPPYNKTLSYWRKERWQRKMKSKKTL